jgi:hypothetical protein
MKDVNPGASAGRSLAPRVNSADAPAAGSTPRSLRSYGRDDLGNELASIAEFGCGNQSGNYIGFIATHWETHNAAPVVNDRISAGLGNHVATSLLIALFPNHTHSDIQHPDFRTNS